MSHIQRILTVINPLSPEAQNLMYALCSEDSDVRYQAIKALNEIGDLSTVASLIEAVKDESDKVREEAAWGLGEIGPKG